MLQNLMNALHIENKEELNEYQKIISEVTFTYVMQKHTLDETEKGKVEKLYMLWLVFEQAA